MASTDFRSVDEYLAAQPKNVQVVLRRVRGIIRKAVSKGTLRFPRSEPVPARMVERIAKFQAREVARRAKAKRARRKKGIEWRKSS